MKLIGFIGRVRMVLPLKTRSAARMIGATVAQLMAAIYGGKLVPPSKDESGDYFWTPEDLDRARAALAVDRRRKRTVEQSAAREEVPTC